MKISLVLAFAALSPIVLAQAGPPPRTGGQMGGAGRPSGGPPAASKSTETETIRLLRLSSVQSDLGLTSDEATQLGVAARSLQGTTATEDTALATVAKVLTSDQVNRLKELLVQDLGYNSLAIADVRAQLSLTADQTTQITSLVSTLETAKAALASSTDASAANKATSTLMAKTSSDLAKVLTQDQDKKLRSLAGRALGAKG